MNRPTTLMPSRSVASFLFLVLVGTLPAVAQQSPETIVAAAVRDAGYECEKPAKPVSDRKAGTADEKVWFIQCGKNRYRVRFMGDQGAKVEPVPGP